MPSHSPLNQWTRSSFYCPNLINHSDLCISCHSASQLHSLHSGSLLPSNPGNQICCVYVLNPLSLSTSLSISHSAAGMLMIFMTWLHKFILSIAWDCFWTPGSNSAILVHAGDSVPPILACSMLLLSRESGQFLLWILPKPVCPTFCGETTDQASRLKLPFLEKTFPVSPPSFVSPALYARWTVCSPSDSYNSSNVPGWREDGKNKEMHNWTPNRNFSTSEQCSVCSILGAGADGVVAVENWIKFTYSQIDSFRFMNWKCLPFYTVPIITVVWITTCHWRCFSLALA